MSNASADTGRRLLPGSARPGVQPLRARASRNRNGPAGLRSARRSGQGLPPRSRKPVGEGADTDGDRLHGVGARSATRRRGSVPRDRARRNRSALRAQLLERAVRGPGRVRGRGGSADGMDGRPNGVPGAQWGPRRSGGARSRTRAVSRSAGARLDPCAVLQVRLRLEAGQRAQVRFLLGQGSDTAEARRLVTRYRSEDLDASPRTSSSGMGGHPLRSPGPHAGPLDGPDAESLAPLPGGRVSVPGAGGFLPGGRRLGLPGPASGCDVVHGRTARAGARASAARGIPAVRRGRRAALVACARRQGRPDPYLGRPALAPVRGAPLRRGHGRRRGARRAGAVSRGSAARARRDGSLLRAEDFRTGCLALRALRPRAGPQPRGRFATACR